MYKTIKYKVIELKNTQFLEPKIKISDVFQLNFNENGIESVITTDKRVIMIDWVDTVLAEFSTKFDKDGMELYTGDLIELTQEVIDELETKHGATPGQLKEGLYTIGWAQGGFQAVHLKHHLGFWLFEEVVIMRAKKVGNQFEDKQMILDYIKPLADEKMEGTDGEIGGAPEIKS